MFERFQSKQSVHEAEVDARRPHLDYAIGKARQEAGSKVLLGEHHYKSAKVERVGKLAAKAARVDIDYGVIKTKAFRHNHRKTTKFSAVIDKAAKHPGILKVERSDVKGNVRTREFKNVPLAFAGAHEAASQAQAEAVTQARISAELNKRRLESARARKSIAVQQTGSNVILLRRRSTIPSRPEVAIAQ